MESSRGGTPRAASAPGLTWRLPGAVALAVGAFAAVDRLVVLLTGSDSILAVLAGFAAATPVATAMLWQTVGPLLADRAALQVQYEAAVADALRDPLTGLGNHRAFHEELERQVAASLRYQVPVSLLVVDLDEFKGVNDGHGHAHGDDVLRAFGSLLDASLRKADRAFRIGGDEFAILLPHTDVEGARLAARRLLAQALQPSRRTGALEPISFSAGVSAVPALAIDPAQLFSQADQALYAAKRAGRTEVAVFDASMLVSSADSAASSSAIADVIARRQLVPVYQPIVSLRDGVVIGVEGLIRPKPPAPFSSPAELFEAAEATGRLTALDLACIDALVAGAAELPANQFLTLNLSPATMEADEFTSGALLAILNRHGFPPDRVVVELTERQQLESPDRVRARVEACRRAGIRFAADDVGAGNAGLRLLSEIRFDILKVDLSLVQRSASDEQSSAVIGSVVEFAELTGALVVAEGIERGHQIDRLMALGISAGQGYFLGRPGPLLPAPVSQAEEAAPATGVAAWRQSIGLPSVS